MSFCQLNLNVQIPSIPDKKLLIQHSGSHDKSKFSYTDTIKDTNIAGIKLYSCGKAFDDTLIRQLPKALLELETPYVYYMEIEKEHPTANYLPPHIDRGRRCAINFYLDCADEITEFYSSDMKLKSSFSAEKNSVWLLDVSTPHSVKFNSEGIRKGVTLSFRHKHFEDIINELKDYRC